MNPHLNDVHHFGSLIKIHTVDGHIPSCATLKPWDTITFVGIYTGIESFQGFLGGAKWISSIRSIHLLPPCYLEAPPSDRSPRPSFGCTAASRRGSFASNGHPVFCFFKSRSPSSTLLPFFRGGLPYWKYTTEKVGCPYSNLSTGGPNMEHPQCGGHRMMSFNCKMCQLPLKDHPPVVQRDIQPLHIHHAKGTYAISPCGSNHNSTKGRK